MKKERLYRIFEQGGWARTCPSTSQERQMIDVLVQLPLGVKEYKTYRTGIKWQDLINTKGLLPDDEIHDIDYVIEKEKPCFGSMREEDELREFYIPNILVSRRRMENDEEYEKRLKRIADQKEQDDKRDRDTYIKLKARFENK